jgi:hypothetical protein
LISSLTIGFSKVGCFISVYLYGLQSFFKIYLQGWGQGEEMTQALYAHMNNKRKKNYLQFYCIEIRIDNIASLLSSFETSS